MKRSHFLGATGGIVALGALPAVSLASESDMTLVTSTGSIFGTLALPASSPPHPVVLIIAGSGPVDRNGNAGLMQSDAYRLLARALARRGIASLRYDKRGIGASAVSAPPEVDLRLETYVDDAAAWVKRLHADKRFSSVTIAGHSEGALIGTLVAQRAPVHALVLLEGAGRPAPVVLLEQLKPKLSAPLYARADAIIAQLASGHLVGNVPPELATLFSPQVQPYIISWFRYDPAAELAKVRIPITIVQGSADIQVTMADADALHRAAPAAKLIVVNGMNHVLKYYPERASLEAALKGYTNPSLPIDPHVVRAIAEAAA